MFNKKRVEDESVLSFMKEGLEVQKRKSPLGPLRTFARVETGATSRGIPRGAIEAQEENEGVVFTKPVYRLAPTPVAVSSASETATFDPFRLKSVTRSAPKRNTKQSSLPQPPFIPAFHYELERFGHMFSNCDMNDIKRKIESELGASGADFEFDSFNWKWTVYAYQSTNKSNHICVRVFRSFDKQDLEKGKLVVEFQKRNGCGWAYHRWLSGLYNKMIEDGIAVKGTEKLRCGITDMPQCFDKEEAYTLKASDLKPLIGMAKAHCSAVQAEAFREIAQIGTRDQNAHELILESDNGILQTIRSVLRDDIDIDVSRCAASALRVLSSSRKTRSIFHVANETNALVSSLCSYLRKPRKLAEKQTQRECVCALRHLCENNVSSGSEVDRILTAFQDLKL